MKSNRLSLLGLQGFASLGGGLVGVFFPFLLGEAFGLSFVSILIWGALFHLSVGLGCEPINQRLRTYISPKQKILIGLFLQAVFFALLGFELIGTGWLIAASILFSLHMILYWPSFHAAIFWSTQTGGRGSFLGSIQGLLIGVNIIAPLISGWLLDQDLGQWISAVSVIFFGLALWMGKKIQLPVLSTHEPINRLSQKNAASDLHKKDTQISGRSTPLPSKSLLLGFIAEGIQLGTLWLIWPIFLRVLGLSFVQIGSIIAMAALVEIFISKIFGYLSDKHCAQYLLHRYGIWARCLDLSSRAVLFFFTQSWILAVVGGLSGLLGPMFQIPMYTRLHQQVEINPHSSVKSEVSAHASFSHIIHFFSLRERILGVTRFVTLLSAGTLYHFFGLPVLPLFLILAGLSSFGFRKF